MRIKTGTPLSNYLDEQRMAPGEAGSQEYYLPVASLATECVILRDEQAITQAELAQRMGTKQSVISRFENLDGRLPSYDFIARLSLALGHSPGMTLRGDFMATVPLEQQALVRDLASREGVSTRAFVESLLDWALSRYQAKEDHVIAFANATEYCVSEFAKSSIATRREVKSEEDLPDFAKAV